MRRHLLSIPVSAAMLLALAGCASSAYPDFDRPATDQDALPSDFDVLDTEGFDLGTARFAGNYDDVGYFLLRSKDGEYCLAIAAGGKSMIGCGDGSGAMGIGASGIRSAQLVPAPARDGNGWIAISENVLVNTIP